ncbi:LOW QUALITY PROTEIN: myocyte-specific enhancer factor 2A-like [Xiphophorus hellerii]|uniref:LOW QUALITY PROTEIN: myocyte-specific enhancer factor 2A-like n=1 Tax=Xiphophorus hellerii TaxID=8084 RepID=UPI0013B38A8B|nr:LOW QUALITY PROTEIN: myocyte-specific enhancer factor 2A-like [Xiphophorus hellerii]
MGRKKIQISRILDERNRQVTFMKRKFGLMKKAYELSVLCDCEIALIIFNSSNKLFQYASTDMDKVLLKYTEYNEPHESRTNTDILEALHKKEHRGCDSPDNESSYVLTPSTEEKYKKINEEFDNMMKSHKVSTGQPQQHFMHAASGSTTYCHGAGGGGGVTSQALAAATAVLSDSGILCSPHTHTHRNTNSSQRPPSTGNTGGLQGSSDLALHNGSGAAVNGFMGSSGGGILGKTGPAKSPSSLPHQASGPIPGGRKGDLRVVVPHCKGMMLSNQRLGGGQSAQPLSTPVVSVATPSLTHQSLGYSSISSAYSSAADYSLNSADMTDFGSAADHSLVSMTPWEQHQLSSLGSANSSLSISSGHNISIKAEPISPPRDHLPQLGYMTHHPAPPHPAPAPHPGSLSSRADMGRSPTGSVGSSCSSHEDGSDREEQQQQQKRRPDPRLLPAARSDGAESPTLKQMRMDGWVT